ncbi:MAG: hypothetical protein D9V45_12875 [Chloroflexi bacterium]|nr:MAG: hypothetical protein D9V45_12875 [Chloroflexota bacterium]
MEKYEYLNPTGGTAVVYYDNERREIVNILLNLNAGGAADFINWTAKKTELPVLKVTQELEKYAQVLPIAVSIQNDPHSDIPPWDEIVPDIGYDRQLLQMLWDGMQYKEIADRLFIDSERLQNRVTELRKKYGEKVIPKQKTIRMRFIKSRYKK